jgi:hypothetical protein
MVIRILLERVFSRQELETRSITGKRSIKSGDLPRPPLDNRRFQLLLAVCRLKCPTLAYKFFIETIQNVQKVLRTRTKKEAVTPKEE